MSGMFLVLRGANMVHDEEWAKQYYNVQQDWFRSERAQEIKIIKMRDEIASYQPLNEISEFLSGFQLYHTDHPLLSQANEKVGAK